jgi:hypothetical protein
LGTTLLHASLKKLADSGISEASVLTRSRVTACKHLYPKFGGKALAIHESEKPSKGL